MTRRRTASKPPTGRRQQPGSGPSRAAKKKPQKESGCSFAVRELPKELASSGNAFLALAILGIGIKLRRRRIGEGDILIGVAVFSYLALLFLLAVDKRYLSKRHVLPLTTILLPWAGGGAAVFLAWLEKKLSGVWPALGRRRNAVMVCAMLLLCAATFPSALRAAKSRRLPEKRLGLWLKENLGDSKKIASFGLPRVALYADAFHLRLPTWRRVPYGGLLDKLGRFEADYLVSWRSDFNRLVTGAEKSTDGGGLSLVHELPWRRNEREDGILVFAVGR